MTTKKSPAEQGIREARRQTHIEQQGYAVGDKVFRVDGKGWITAMNPDTVTIAWDGDGTTEEDAAYIERSTLGHFVLVTGDETMTAIQTTIRDYLVSQSDTCYLLSFVGMIETGEASYEDFAAVGGEKLAATVRKAKQRCDDDRVLDDFERSDDSDMFDESWN